MTEDNIEEMARHSHATLDSLIEEGKTTVSDALEFAFKNGIDWFKLNLWHDGKEEPKHNGMCLVYASYEYEEYPEDNYSEYTTSAWHGDWTEDHFPSDADVTIQKWCYIKDLIL